MHRAGNASLNADRLLLTFLSLYLIIDSANGWLVLSFGIDVKLSALYKGMLLAFVALRVLRKDVVKFEFALICVLILMLGETLFLLSGKTSGSHLSFAFLHGVKIISPLLLFFYFESVLAKGADYRNAVDRILIFSSLVFAANIVLGFLGFGFSTYDGEVTASSVGLKGFFYAGNEVTSVFIVLSAFVLSRFAGCGWRMWLAILGCLTIGLAIATKTAIISAIILSFGVPMLLNDPGKRPYFVGKFFLLAAVPVSVVYWLLGDSLFPIAENLVGRISDVHQKQGLIGVILSSRDVYLADLWRVSFSGVPDLEVAVAAVFGHGVSYFADVVKYSSEMDFADVFFWNGLLGVLVLFSVVGLSSFHAVHSYILNRSFDGKVVLFTNALLLVSANIGGHIFTSGMFSIVWAALCARCMIPIELRARVADKPVFEEGGRNRCQLT